jgi:hypothetical protein
MMNKYLRYYLKPEVRVCPFREGVSEYSNAPIPTCSKCPYEVFKFRVHRFAFCAFDYCGRFYDEYDSLRISHYR